MAEESISYNLSVDGRIFSSPAHIVIGSQKGKVAFGGIVRWGERSLSDAVSESHTELPKEAKAIVNALLPDCYPKELAVQYYNDIFTISLQDGQNYFKLAKSPDNTALLYAIRKTDGNNKTSEDSIVKTIRKILDGIADFFGIRQFMMYVQSGKQSLLSRMLPDGMQAKQLPAALKTCTMLTYACINFENDSIFCRGMRSLFGIESTEFYLGMTGKNISCMITLPAIDTKYIKSSDLYILLEYGTAMQFLLKGRFFFPYLKGMEFTVDCGIKETAFQIEALAQVERPLELFGPFAIGDTCLMIQAGSELKFGLYSSLYIRSLEFFGAVMLKETAGAIYPTLLSAAMSDLSIPILADNILGEHIEGIEVLDFIKIMGLQFQEVTPFPMEQVTGKDTAAIVSHFNEAVTSEFLQLEESQVQITPYADGADLTDLKRMRHYHISHEGKLQLAAQFYYAAENMTFGNYSIEKGFFLCGVIEIFHQKFEALFSMRESEGILAYAKIPAIDLGFIRIDASDFQKSQNTSLPIAKNSLLAQFVNPQEEGMVFFLSAGKKDVSFYFDGSIEILKRYRADARVIYMNRNISIDFYTMLYGLFRASMHLLVNYESFTSADFAFSFQLDTSGLTEKLTAVTQKIDGAVDQLRNKIDNAQKEIKRAQNHVNELYGQLSVLDGRIADCRNAIREASWWKKAFVAVVKGAEIGAYEVAKGGIYTAIGLATSALQVAKGVLEVSGNVGENLLKAVSQVIKGAMTLFYINYIRLEAKADINSQYFLAEMDFVVLGKKYYLKKEIGKGQLSDNPVSALSDSINDRISYDIEHIEDGTFRSTWRKYDHEEYTLEQNSRRLEESKKHLQASIKFIQSMQNTYVDNLHITLEECDEMNVSFLRALNQVENVLQTGAQAGNVAVLGNAMGGLKRSIALQEKSGVFRDGESSEIQKLIAEYDKARGLYDDVLESIKAVRKFQKEMEKHSDKMRRKTSKKNCMVMPEKMQMAKVLLQVEEQMYEAFPVDYSSEDFINLSKEAAMQEYFMKAGEKLGAEPSRNIQVMRNRSRKGDYRNRLS